MIGQSPLRLPALRTDLPVYPQLDQLVRVTSATVPGPAGVTQVAGSSFLGPTLYVGYVQQLREDSLLPRDREPCLVDDVNGAGLLPGFYNARLSNSFNSLPVFAVGGLQTTSQNICTAIQQFPNYVAGKVNVLVVLNGVCQFVQAATDCGSGTSGSGGGSGGTCAAGLCCTSLPCTMHGNCNNGDAVVLTNIGNATWTGTSLLGNTMSIQCVSGEWQILVNGSSVVPTSTSCTDSTKYFVFNNPTGGATWTIMF